MSISRTDPFLNLALPLSNWTPVQNGSGNFDGNGDFSTVITVGTNQPQQFFILETQ